jgi:NADH-quinone oxidoreductase subunit J
VFEITYEIVVFALGVTAVLAAFGVILCASPIYCALYLIGNMICLALLFLLYNAEFIAAVQIIVYAGAVMILFLFIIALLGGKKEMTESSLQRTSVFAFVILLLCELLLAAGVKPTRPITGDLAPDVINAIGSAKAVGIELFSRHLIPFELASILLLIATVGIICLAKFSYLPARRHSK